MKKIYLLILIIFILFNSVYPQITIQLIALNGNNIKAYIKNTGIIDQDTLINSPGFEWPIGSGKYAIFTAGLTVAGYFNGSLRMAANSYKGELIPGYCIMGIPYTNSNFKIYKVKIGDNQYNNPDWLNWGLMVPYGAPFFDANNNGTYEPAIDTPGVRKATQTIFICMTDGFYSSHNPGEGFGGGTQPLFAEYHFTAWCYNRSGLQDVQFLKWDVINKSTYAWDSSVFSIVSDPDLGNGNDDYIGVDTTRRLGYCYNGDNDDPVYGIAPPAVGMILLKGVIRKNIIPNIHIGLSSYGFFSNSSSSPPPCESDPNGEPYPAYLMMSGFKKDSSNWLNPMYSPPKKTKFTFPGDPETNSGWTEYKGSINNCGGDSGTYIVPNPKGDRRFCLSSGKIKVNANDTQKIIVAQLIRRGSSNLNSVSLLKQYADSIIAFYNSGFTIGVNNISTNIPKEFMLYQNYPNPFNPMTKIKFDIQKSTYIKLTIYNSLGQEISILADEIFTPGTYEVEFNGENYPSGVYFYRLEAEKYKDTKKLILLK